MRTTLTLAALAVLAPATAHAAQGAVYPNMSVFYYPTSANLVLVECDAQALPEQSNDVPIATTVKCVVDGVEQNGAAPGAVAASAFVTVARQTFTACVSATATFHNPLTHDVYTVSHPGMCQTVVV